MQDQGRQTPLTLPPQASSSRFKPAAQARPPMNMPLQGSGATIGRPTGTQQPHEANRRRTVMGPPPTPCIPTPKMPFHPLVGYETNPVPQPFQTNPPGLTGNHRFTPALNGQQAGPTAAHGQRFAPPVQHGSSAPQRFLPPSAAASGSRAPSRSGDFDATGAQRIPFMPSAHGRFG